MAAKSRRGSRGGKRAQRGKARKAEFDAIAADDAAYDKLVDTAHQIYSAALEEVSGLRPYPATRTSHMFYVPLPRGWLLEITSGDDGPLFPPDHEDGNHFVFWLTTPEGLYAEEDALSFDCLPEDRPLEVAAYACRVIWRHLAEILGESMAVDEVRDMVGRGDLTQPPLEQT